MRDQLKINIEPGTCFWHGTDLLGSEIRVYWAGYAGPNELNVPEKCLKVADALGIKVKRGARFPLFNCEFDYDLKKPIDPRVIAFLDQDRDNEASLALLRPLSELENEHTFAI